MKTALICALSTFALFPTFPLTHAQEIIKERGPHEARVEYLTQTADADGKITVSTNAFTALATGMNRWDPDVVSDHQKGAWVPASPRIQVVQGRGVAAETQHKVIFSGDVLGDEDIGTLDLLMPDGQTRLVMRPMGVALTDASGKSVWLGECRSTAGEIVGDAQNVIEYRNCFDGAIEGTIRFTMSLAAVEQDVIIEKWPQFTDDDIKAFGLDPGTVKLECWSRVVNNATPQKRDRLIEQNPDNFGTDALIDFGSMTMPLGKAFSVGQNDGPPVLKDWTVIDGATFLIEQVNLGSVRQDLQALPAKAEARNIDRTKAKTFAAKAIGGKRVKPVSLLAARAHSPKEKGQMRLASAAQKTQTVAFDGGSKQKGLVIDYTVLSTGSSNFRFKGSETFYITGPCVFSGNAPGTRFQSGAVCKFAPTNSAKIKVTGPIIWEGTGYRPVVLTARDDASVGAPISGAGSLSGTYADIALEFDADSAGTNALIQNFRIAHASTGIAITGKTGHILKHGIFVNCNVGIQGNRGSGGCEFSLRNALFVNVLTNLLGNGTSITGRLEHVTVDLANWFNYNGTISQLTVTNSLLVGVTNTGTFVSSGLDTISSSNLVFTASGQGGHYLLPASSSRSGAVTNVTIAAELKNMTVDAPILLTTDFSSNTVLGPAVQRDTNVTAKGFHYWPLDYLCSGLNQTNNCSVTLTNSAALAYYGPSAIKFRNGAKFYCEGAPGHLNHLTSYNTVQENPVAWGSTPVGIFDLGSIASTYPEVRLRFTDVSLLGGDVFNGRRFLVSAGASGLQPLAVSHCQLRGISLSFADSTYSGNIVALTNNILDQVDSTWTSSDDFFSFTLSAYNNLFHDGTVTVNTSVTSPSWTVKDNLFDCDSITRVGTPTFTVANNAYRSGLTSLGGSSNIVNLSMDYVAGPFGTFYYPTNGSNLHSLVEKGSRSSPNAGLYFFTTDATASTREGSSQVDIGAHFPSADANGNPLDSDGDGIWDGGEDRSGNGSVDSGESNPFDPFDQIFVKITKPNSASPLP